MPIRSSNAPKPEIMAARGPIRLPVGTGAGNCDGLLSGETSRCDMRSPAGVYWGRESAAGKCASPLVCEVGLPVMVCELHPAVSLAPRKTQGNSVETVG